MKEWKCVLVGHHENVGKVIDECEKAGWRLHTYQTAGMGGTQLYRQPLLTVCEGRVKRNALSVQGV